VRARDQLDTSSITPPPLRFPDPVRADLDKHRAGLADETERNLHAHIRPCVAVTAERVSAAPLRRSALRRLFGAREASPVLGVMESKFGGLPYCEEIEDWEHHSFLGQIDLDRATGVFPDGTPKLSGLLRFDVAFDERLLRVRWFREPSPDRAIAAAPRSVGNWETRLRFGLTWTLPEGSELEALWPLREPAWFEYDAFYPPGYNTDDRDDFHRLLGHKSSGLDEPSNFKPVRGAPQAIADYEQLLCITYDNTADFGWGTNWLYLLVPREDLARGDLSRIVVTGANS
jgi:hypothetical protein